MQFLRSRAGLLGGLVAIAIMLVTLVAGVGTAAAASLTYSLTPTPGSNATGTGSITMNAADASQPIHVDLTGARVATTYTVSTCANTGVAYACTAGTTFTTDAAGAFHGDIPVPAVMQIDLITLASTIDPLNGYQAVTGTVPVLPLPAGVAYPATTVTAVTAVSPSGFSSPLLYPIGSYPIVYGFVGLSGDALVAAQIGPDNTLLVPLGTATTLQYACPAGYSGPVIVVAFGAPGPGVPGTFPAGVSIPSAALQLNGAGYQYGYCQA